MDSTRRNIVEETILANDPVAYYPLGEPAGSLQANDVSVAGADPLLVTGSTFDNPLVFGTATGPGTDGITAVQFAAGQTLRRAKVNTAPPWTIETFFLASNNGASLLSIESPTKSPFLELRRAAVTGLLQVSGSAPMNPGTVMDAGQTYHAALTMDAAGARELFLNGVSVATSTVGAAFAIDTLTAGSSLQGVLAHIAITPRVLTAAQIAAHAQAGLTGFAGETTDARLKRYAALAGVPEAEISAEPGVETVSHVPTAGAQIVTLLRLMEATEGGALYDARDNTLTLHNRRHRMVSTSAFVLDVAKQQVKADFAPVLDRSFLYNDITVTTVDNTRSARAADSASIKEYGRVADPRVTASLNPDEPAAQVQWRLNQFSTPRIRVPTLTVDLLAQVGATPGSIALASAAVGTLLSVINQPPQAPSPSASYFVEGATETLGPELWRITFNVSPASPYGDVLIWDDLVRGAWDSYKWAY